MRMAGMYKCDRDGLDEKENSIVEGEQGEIIQSKELKRIRHKWPAGCVMKRQE
jgi:hypothetical protein